MINCTRNLSFVAALIAVATMGLVATPANAQEKETGIDERIAEFEQRMEETRERLQLSEEQIAGFKKIQEEQSEELRERQNR